MGHQDSRDATAEIIRRHADGQSIRYIAEALQVSRDKVEVALRDHTAELHDGPSRSRLHERKALPLTNREIVERYRSGQTLKNLAAECGADELTIRRRLRDEGVDIVPPASATGGVRATHQTIKETEAAIVQQYTSGSSLNEVAEAFGVHLSVVRRVLNQHGIARRAVGGRAGVRVLNDEQQKAIVQQYREGASEYSLTKKFGVSKSAIRNVLQTHSIQRRGHDEARSLHRQQTRKTDEQA